MTPGEKCLIQRHLKGSRRTLRQAEGLRAKEPLEQDDIERIVELSIWIVAKAMLANDRVIKSLVSAAFGRALTPCRRQFRRTTKSSSSIPGDKSAQHRQPRHLFRSRVTACLETSSRQPASVQLDV